jgi:hypothetical protein
MRMLGYAALAVFTMVTLGQSEEIQRWTDADGHVHYMNLPGGHGGGGGGADIVERGGEPTDVATHTQPGGDAEDPRNAAIPPPAQGANAANDAQDAYSTQASLRRATLERDLRSTEKRIKEIDDQLAGLEKIRGKNAAGSVATGGVRASMEVRSPEEAQLAEEREKLDKHATEVRTDYAKLREEVSARLGSTPAWWIDVR